MPLARGSGRLAISAPCGLRTADRCCSVRRAWDHNDCLAAASRISADLARPRERLSLALAQLGSGSEVLACTRQDAPQPLHFERLVEHAVDTRPFRALLIEFANGAGQHAISSSIFSESRLSASSSTTRIASLLFMRLATQGPCHEQRGVGQRAPHEGVSAQRNDALRCTGVDAADGRSVSVAAMDLRHPVAFPLVKRRHRLC